MDQLSGKQRSTGPLLSLRRPTAEAVRRFVESQAGLELTYTAVGATAAELPPLYATDRVRARLGKGEATYRTARSALERWEQFRLGWIDVAPPPRIEAGAVAAILVRTAGVWWLNASRIVYVIDESAPRQQFGFAYGTLPGHAETGEERFLVERDADDAVWYSIVAFSRPRHRLARLGRVVVRRMQRRFGRGSAAAMVRACAARDA